MSETTANISDEVSVSDDEEPNIDQLLTSSNWEKRLAEARVQRAKVLAKKGKTETKPQAESLGFEPDQQDIAGQLVSVLQRRDSVKEVEGDVLPPSLDDVGDSVPAAAVPRNTPAKPKIIAAASPSAEAPNHVFVAPAEPAPTLFRRSASVLVACSVGLGIGLALGFGLILGFDWMSRSKTADLSPSVASPAEPSVVGGLGGDAAPETEPSELSPGTVQPELALSDQGFDAQPVMAEPDAPAGSAQVLDTPVVADLQAPPVVVETWDQPTVTEAQQAPVLAQILEQPGAALRRDPPQLPEVQVAALSPVPQPDAVVPLFGTLAPVQSQSGAAAAQFDDVAPAIPDTGLIAPGGDPQDGVPVFVLSSGKVSVMSALPAAPASTQGFDTVNLSPAILSSPLPHTEVKIPDGVSVAYNVPLSSPSDQVSDVVPTLFRRTERVSAVTELPPLQTPAQSDVFAITIDWAETVPVSYAGPQIETAAVSDARLPFVEGPPLGETNLATQLGLSSDRLTGLKLYVHAPESVTETALAERMAMLGSTGITVAPVERESYKVSATHLRYYSKADADVATALADEMGVTARDFTKNGAKPGRIEIYLAGTANTKTATPKPRAATRRTKQRKPAPVDPRVQLRDQLVDALRRGDHL